MNANKRELKEFISVFSRSLAVKNRFIVVSHTLLSNYLNTDNIFYGKERKNLDNHIYF